MSEINRSLVILRPKQPFLNWGMALDDEDKNFTLEHCKNITDASLDSPQIDEFDVKTAKEISPVKAATC